MAISIKYFVIIKMFKSLVSTVSEQCQQIKQGMASFPYFNTWDDNTIAECCRVSSPAEIPPNQIILGPGVGDAHTVYFIMEGTCRIVEHLLIRVARNCQGKQIEKLCKSDESITSEETKHRRFLSRLFNRTDSLEPEEKGIQVGDDAPQSFNSDSKMAEEENEKLDDLDHLEGVKAVPEFEESTEKIESGNGKRISENGMETETTSEKENSKEINTDCYPATDTIGLSKKEALFETDRHLKVLEECQKRRTEAICILKSEILKDKPKNVKSVFIESGILLTGACFGLGKLGKDNFVMSSTRVKVLKIPLRFLLNHNPCNIWNRIALFHNLYLFKEKKIFEYFQNERRWADRKKNETDRITSIKNIPNYTSTGDVPYWIRLTDTR